MAEILPFKKPSPAQKHKGKSLCRHGFHKWKVDQAKKFDVKKGKLATVSVCTRCGERKTEYL